MFYYTYLIQSLKDNKWYTGATEDLRKRFREHNSRKVFSTKGRGPFQLIYYESCLDRNDAFAREKFLKSGPGKRYLKNRLKCFRLSTGFTLIELLVVIAIVIFLSALAFPNYRLGEQKFALENAIAMLNRNLRSVEEMAMSSKEFHDIIPRGGYGIYAENNADSYIIFADCGDAPDLRYTPTGNECNGFPELIETVDLGEQVYVSALSPAAPLNILFTAPKPTVTISGSGDEAIITIALRTDPTKTKIISVNSAGLIEITK